jgi:hypothetical protein
MIGPDLAPQYLSPAWRAPVCKVQAACRLISGPIRFGMLESRCNVEEYFLRRIIMAAAPLRNGPECCPVGRDWAVRSARTTHNGRKARPAELGTGQIPKRGHSHVQVQAEGAVQLQDYRSEYWVRRYHHMRAIPVSDDCDTVRSIELPGRGPCFRYRREGRFELQIRPVFDDGNIVLLGTMSRELAVQAVPWARRLKKDTRHR